MFRRALSVTGTVASITYPGHGLRPEVVVNIDVKNATLQLVFQSRRTIHCLDIGQRVRVSGAVVKRQGIPCIYNPMYTIVKGHND
ncbi:hypothetical protein [Arcanobacterium buesumense]|uniref:DNA-binding protein n=1 Tax=Arcanobacterium buesumense TaxID=2722751 RepID=A0A6H2EKI0_9ACTO|nr:hypothetical protein [Arcanobacterium buesumense]QJC21694.1 hypothetical protein HC352_03685 [Arcanobacterium buesumense]